MFNVERVKALVESTIDAKQTNGMVESVEAIDLPGSFGPDMCQSIDVSIMESIVELHEFTSGASSILIEAACDPTSTGEKLTMLSEATQAGVKERVVAFFKKVAGFFKTLATKIASYFTAFMGMTKKWSKVAASKIKAATDNGAKKKVRSWNMTDINKLADGMNSASFAQLSGALNMVDKIDAKEAESVVVGKLLSGVTSIKGIDEWVKNTAGAKAEPSEVAIFPIKDQLLEVVEKAGELGKKISDECKKLSKMADDEGKKWQKNVKEIKKDDGADDDVKQAKAIMTAWGVGQKAFNRYAAQVQGITRQAARESMMALNALLGKSKKDDSNKK